VRRITGTTIYTYVACPRAADLDLHEDRANRRPLSEAEELSRQRGRELEALRTAELGFAEPRYGKGDYDDGAAQTLALLRQGVAGVTQGVLADGHLLGIPDLLRKEPGSSALGDFHYVVGDVKSSSAARADQALQVAFYGRLLGKLQGRAPSYGFLWLKDGREQRLPLDEFAPVLDDVMARVAALAQTNGVHERAFWSAACRSCHWSELCAAELTAREDLSLVAGMTRGLRATLEAAGIARAGELCEAAPERLAKRAHLEGALVRRLQLAARAWRLGEPLPAADSVLAEGAVARGRAVLHVLVDTFAERLLCVGSCVLDGPRTRRTIAVPLSAKTQGAKAQTADEWRAFEQVAAAVPPGAALLHFGAAVPSWLQRGEAALAGDVDVHGRLVDIARRLRGAVAFPAPVFGLRDAVRHGLQRDPDRKGAADAAPLWLNRVDAEARLRAKMAQDLDDLAALVTRFLPLHPAPAPAPQQTAGA
jgi:predicted RecB family nuclease